MTNNQQKISNRVNQRVYQSFDNSRIDQKNIETLKAARNQVMRAPLKTESLAGQADPVKNKPSIAAAAAPAAGRVSKEADKSSGENTNINSSQNPSPKQAHNKLAPLEIRAKELKGQQLSQNTADHIRKSQFSNGATKFLTGFAEEFVQKMASIERKKAAVDEEIAKAEKLWSSLAEKKKTLESRRNELIKVKDKLTVLNKEMDNVLSSN